MRKVSSTPRLDGFSLFVRTLAEVWRIGDLLWHCLWASKLQSKAEEGGQEVALVQSVCVCSQAECTYRLIVPAMTSLEAKIIPAVSRKYFSKFQILNIN